MSKKRLFLGPIIFVYWNYILTEHTSPPVVSKLIKVTFILLLQALISIFKCSIKKRKFKKLVDYGTWRVVLRNLQYLQFQKTYLKMTYRYESRKNRCTCEGNIVAVLVIVFISSTIKLQTRFSQLRFFYHLLKASATFCQVLLVRSSKLLYPLIRMCLSCRLTFFFF